MLIHIAAFWRCVLMAHGVLMTANERGAYFAPLSLSAFIRLFR